MTDSVSRNRMGRVPFTAEEEAAKRCTRSGAWKHTDRCGKQKTGLAKKKELNALQNILSDGDRPLCLVQQM